MVTGVRRGSSDLREVFLSRVSFVNPTAVTMNVNGLTGQEAYELSTLLYSEKKKHHNGKINETQISYAYCPMFILLG